MALRTQPPAAVSAMDGYAVRAADVAQAPATLKLIGEVAAGHPFDGTVGAGEAARIFTGGVLPDGADTVVIQEHATRDGDTRHRSRSRRAKGRNVRGQGIDFAQGAGPAARGPPPHRPRPDAGRRHEPSARCRVHRRPKVAVLGTGDELVAPGSTPGPGEIVYSNGFALIAHGAQRGRRGHRSRHRAATASRTSRRRSAARATGAPIFW